MYHAYDSLETRIGDVGNTAIRIGEQLETIDKQRSRASESRDIIEYFMEFQEGNSERLRLLCEGGEEGQLKVNGDVYIGIQLTLLQNRLLLFVVA